jgi:gag-polypeptide of LTR copia-type/Zinc knuckle
MSTVNEVKKAIKVIQFDGKQSSWTPWDARWCARAIKRGYFNLLVGEDDDVFIPKISEEGKTYKETAVDDQGKQITTKSISKADVEKATQYNLNGFAELLMSMDWSTPVGRVVFDMVNGTKCADYPHGNLRVAYKRLKLKFSPQTTLALSTIYKRYAASKLRKGHDPDVFLTYLQDLRTQMADMGQVYDDKAFMIHVLSNLGEDYELVQYHLDHRMADKKNPLTIDELREELNSRYERIRHKYSQNAQGNSSGNNISRNREGGERACRKCGVIGHKAADCWSSGNKSSGKQGPKAPPRSDSATPATGIPKPPETSGGSLHPRFQGTCNYCKRTGHRESQCFDKLRDQRDAANTAIECCASSTTQVEEGHSSQNFGFTVMETCHAVSLFGSTSNKDLWIADTGASCHMTCNPAGMFNCVDINEDIKVGDGNYIKATKMGCKHVLVSQPGGVIKSYVINDCKYVPKLWINLFSVTSALCRGWNLSNNGIIMSITKNGYSLVFDQVLPTSSGAIAGVLMKSHVIPHAHVSLDVTTQEDVRNSQDTVETPTPIIEAPPVAAMVPERPMITRDVNDLHHMFGHAHFDAIKRSAKYYNIKLKGDVKTCVA